MKLSALSLLFLHASAIVGYGRDEYKEIPARQKLVRIVLPIVEFHLTTLEAALEFLRQESRRVDTEPDPKRRGVNLILQAGASLSANSRITLNLHHVPLGEALKYVASQAGLRVKVEPYAASLVSSADAGEPLVTAIIPVPPAFLGSYDPERSGRNTHGERLD